MPAAAADYTAKTRTDSKLLIRLVHIADYTGIKLRAIACRLQHFHFKNIYDDAGLFVFFKCIQAGA